jgi:hypothetical protein
LAGQPGTTAQHPAALSADVSKLLGVTQGGP